MAPRNATGLLITLAPSTYEASYENGWLWPLLRTAKIFVSRLVGCGCRLVSVSLCFGIPTNQNWYWIRWGKKLPRNLGPKSGIRLGGIPPLPTRLTRPRG